MAIKTFLVSLALTLPFVHAATPCVNGVAAYSVTFDNLPVDSPVPSGTAQLDWNTEIVINSTLLCTNTGTPCTPLKPNTSPNYLLADPQTFSLVNENPKGPFVLQSFYFGCQTSSSSGFNPSSCTLEVIEDTSAGLVTTSFNFVGSTSSTSLRKASLSSKSSKVYFHLTSAPTRTVLVLDSFAIAQTC